MSFGGATDNVIRGVQWLLAQKNPGATPLLDGAWQNDAPDYVSVKGVTGYVGCVGDDEDGDKIKKSFDGMGIETVLKVATGIRTGACN